MNRTDEEAEITKLRQIKWKTSLSRRLEDFSEIISDDDIFEKYFGEKYVEQLANKSKAITRTIIKLGVIYTVLMLSLYASQNINESEFEIFGYGFKNLAYYKEFLLLLAVIISPISAVLVAYQKYLVALIKECLKKLSPNTNIRQFYSHMFLDEYFEGLLSHNSGISTSWHGFTKFLMVTFVLMILFLILTLVAGSFFIQINVIYDVATKPASSQYMNIFVIVFSITSILFSWLVSILQLPMPEVDTSNYSKLLALEKENSERYQEIMKRLAKENANKDALSSIVLSVIIYIATFTGIAMYWFSGILNDPSYFLEKAMPGAFVVMFFSKELVGYIRKQVMAWFFRNYPDESDQRLFIFGKIGKMLFSMKIIIPFCLSIGYSLYVLTSN